MPGTAPVLGTSGESRVTLVGALCLCPAKERKKKYREKKSGWYKDRVRKARVEEGERRRGNRARQEQVE